MNEQGTEVPQDVEDPRVKGLVRDIEMRLADSGDVTIWGHGTSREIAERILEEGIEASPSYSLTEIALPITRADTPLQQQGESLVTSCLQWPHRDSKAVVLLSVPHALRRHQIVESIERGGQERHHIPPRFIVGYIDAVDCIFVPNPLHERNPAPTTLMATELPQKGPWGGSRLGNSGDIPRFNPVSDSEIPDVW